MADSEEIYSGRLIRVLRETVAMPDGNETTLDIVRHPGGAVIAPIREDGEVCLLRQYRYAAGGEIWEFPAGCLDPGETPLETAKRELAEETGLVANSWLALGEMLPSPGFCDEVLHLFLARDLSPGTANQADDEFIEIHWFSQQAMLDMARAGEIRDGKTLALLLKLLPIVDRSG